jgi:hypothetical protein
MRASPAGSPRIAQRDTIQFLTERLQPSPPGYEATVAATGIDPDKIFEESAADCSCNWSGHRIYNLR